MILYYQLKFYQKRNKPMKMKMKRILSMVLLSTMLLNTITASDILEEPKCKKIIKNNYLGQQYTKYAISCLSKFYVNEQKGAIMRAASVQLKDQKLLDITTKDNYIIYHYEYPTEFIKTMNRQLDKRTKILKFCQNFSTNLMVRKGFYFELIYTKPNGMKIYSVKINNRTCNQI